MNILCIGDVVGRSGVEMAAGQIKYLKQDYNADFVIINGENAADGLGIDRWSADTLIDAGADVITTGNHAFSKKSIYTLFDKKYPIIRPLNCDEDQGAGYIVKECNGIKIAVINILGRVFMKNEKDPFKAAREVVDSVDADMIFVDFHAEATSEKLAMGHYLSGRATCVFGTHTHVQTADEWIINGKTAYITDVGMTGPYNSVLGVKTEIAVGNFINGTREKYKTAEGNCRLDGIVVSAGSDGIASKVTRFSIK